MASIDCYFKTDIVCHQIGSAHKNTEIGLYFDNIPCYWIHMC